MRAAFTKRSPRAGSLKVLLVEDSKVLAERMTEAILEVDGVTLIGATDTESAAIGFLRTHIIDVIVLDLHLRQGTGFGVMQTVAACTNRPRPTIIVLTNYDLPEYKTAALALGATHFLDKAHDYGHLPDMLLGMARAQTLATQILLS